MKKILLIVLIAVLGIFIYIKVQVNGDSQSSFNKTTRFSLGRYGIMRTIFGLHNDGDARAAYLQNTGPIVIEWFKPVSEELDQVPVNKFATLVGQYMNRPVQVIYGGAVSDATVSERDLAIYNIEAVTDSSANTFAVFFTTDYAGRPDEEISRTYKEIGMVVSIKAHKDFVKNYSQELNKYYLSSMLHEFGHQIGLDHNDDPNCIMSTHAGLGGQPVENYGQQEPQDYCPKEQELIKQLKLEFK